jgi:hypothetical protein
MLARDAFFPYAAPESRSEILCKDIIRAGKQILTFRVEANQSLLAMGAKPIRVEDLKNSIKDASTGNNFAHIKAVTFSLAMEFRT